MKSFLNYLTSSFLTHINIELSKDEKILNNIDIGKKPARIGIKKVHNEIYKFYPNIKPIEFNFVYELNVIRLNKQNYYDSSFEGFDIVFWESIKDLQNLTKESRKTYKKTVVEILKNFDHKKFGLKHADFFKIPSRT